VLRALGHRGFGPREWLTSFIRRYRNAGARTFLGRGVSAASAAVPHTGTISTSQKMDFIDALPRAVHPIACAIDFREGEKVNEAALKTLVRAAVTLNKSKAKS